MKRQYPNATVTFQCDFFKDTNFDKKIIIEGVSVSCMLNDSCLWHYEFEYKNINFMFRLPYNVVTIHKGKSTIDFFVSDDVFFELKNLLKHVDDSKKIQVLGSDDPQSTYGGISLLKIYEKTKKTQSIQHSEN